MDESVKHILEAILVAAVLMLLVVGCERLKATKVEVGYDTFIEGVQDVAKECGEKHSALDLNTVEKKVTLTYVTTARGRDCIIAQYERAATKPPHE